MMSSEYSLAHFISSFRLVFALVIGLAVLRSLSSVAFCFGPAIFDCIVVFRGAPPPGGALARHLG